MDKCINGGFWRPGSRDNVRDELTGNTLLTSPRGGVKFTFDCYTYDKLRKKLG